MKNWEYKVIPKLCNSFKDEEDWLNALGELGWELVAVRDNGAHYFKRPVSGE
jgi:hypothetical protein